MFRHVDVQARLHTPRAPTVAALVPRAMLPRTYGVFVTIVTELRDIVGKCAVEGQPVHRMAKLSALLSGVSPAMPCDDQLQNQSVPGVQLWQLKLVFKEQTLPPRSDDANALVLIGTVVSAVVPMSNQEWETLFFDSLHVHLRPRFQVHVAQRLHFGQVRLISLPPATTTLLDEPPVSCCLTATLVGIGGTTPGGLQQQGPDSRTLRLPCTFSPVITGFSFIAGSIRFLTPRHPERQILRPTDQGERLWGNLWPRWNDQPRQPLPPHRAARWVLQRADQLDVQRPVASSENTANPTQGIGCLSPFPCNEPVSVQVALLDVQWHAKLCLDQPRVVACPQH
mmetsp:Transcript_93208/g.241271  ORF Transcript_93208/g.241271 Transcript_93208/m.241271 type:complete len:339 (+) Transcript_93208:216-1232(+)